ncbi:MULTISPECIES: TetR/AcrR family transcriptional regulator C-terminal domain-containing protein [unclassified Streptomyces]|uniref:TetR/AcrR family transcriptional regulator C-terminal domain-containing protein n=1 Tax=Streptomyces evansiae TaxID=3075535 RepID=A0ABU2R0B2_9ACTN|nr:MULTISPECIES: TetR/AcrR family transcriptional regulator C-terminal domain-containing protein [unclassified Streptomyces]MYQ57667.1 TetR family transcriptional regulator [Streptomyces sp. SID4926]MYR30057.1 TetR family transcriptional regulator [Streptomyces sp. SID4945]EFL03737.1 tetracycline resistance repressor protein [Streptomyces sp. SPB78]MDT0410153.1 TetR/AcrR family transcriptional regulator C-terminal domain-containing protein [Streptomyces sp. DSM 41979]SCD66279.1 transcriptional
MTKKQAEDLARTRLDPATVVRTALELLDEKGADGLSIRGIADRLGVRMNTVLWHAKTKARLLELMADAIVAGAPVDGLPEPWEPRVRELFRRYRRALLAHRDGARIVAGTYAAEPATLRFADLMTEALLAGGLTEREAVWTGWSLVYFTLGLAQEEQAQPDVRGPAFVRRLDSGEYPSLSRAAPYFEDTSFDERFDYGLSRILGV